MTTIYGNEFTKDLPPPARVKASDEVGELLVFAVTILAQWTNRQCHYNLVIKGYMVAELDQASRLLAKIKQDEMYGKAIQVVKEVIAELMWANSIDNFLTILEGKEAQWQADNDIDQLVGSFFSEVRLKGNEVLETLSRGDNNVRF